MDALPELIGHSSSIEALRTSIRQLARAAASARHPPPVLITGETGTGKGLVARVLHRLGPRATGPLVDVNCAAIPETLLEAELFGYERGAFTGAQRAKPGLFHTAHGGTLFLDEIGLLGSPMQAKLLKALEDRAVRRLGATRGEPVDVWVVSATNADLLAAIREKRFREDLYHRLAVVTLSLTAVRDRAEDALTLAEHFLARACRDHGLPACTLTPDARRQILAYPWPGNVREMANAMERAALLAASSQITASALALPRAAAPSGGMPARGGSLDDVVRDHVRAVLDEVDGNITRAAATLGITRSTLRGYIEKFALTVPAGGRGRGRRGPVPAVPPPADAAPVEERAPPPDTAPPPAASGLRWAPRLVAFLAVALRGPADTPMSAFASITHELFEIGSGFGGRLEDVGPQAMVLTFGLDMAEDGAPRAAAAAIASRGALARLSSSAGGGIAGRWALHVSRCVIASGTDVDRVDAGDKEAALAILGALGEVADDSAILVSAPAVRHLERRFELTPTSHAIAEGGLAHQLVGREHVGFEVSGRALSRFVGRDHDLAVLHHRLASATAGHGQGVTIVGEPGMGKSRLLYEFRRSLASQPVTFLEGRCLSYGTTTPYLPIAGLVRQSFALTEMDDPETVSAALREGLDALGVAADTLAYLLHLLGFKPGTEQLQGQSPEAIRQGTLEVLKRLAILGSRRQPIVVAVEDLQWIDSASEAALASLAESLPTARVLLLTTQRPGYRLPWLERAHVTQLALGSLAPAPSLAVLESVLPEALPDAVAQRILARADGVPFFLEELARSVVESGRDLGAVVLPATIEGALGARVERLPPLDRDILQAAAVIGKDFARSLVASVARVPDHEVGSALERLRAAEFVFDQSAAESRDYTFKHALTHEVTYRSLLDPQRRELHGRVADALEALGPQTGERWPEMLAHHHTEAGRPREAIEYWLRAAQHALQRSASAEALAHLRRGLTLLEGLPDGLERERRELVLQLTLCTALAAQHGYGAAAVEHAMVRIRELTRELHGAPELLVGRFALWRFALSRADFAQAEGLAAQLVVSVEGQADPQAVIPGLIASGVTDFYLGNLDRAERHCARVIALQQPAFGRAQAVLYGQDLGVAAFSFLGWTLALRGRLDGGAEAADRALGLARQGGHRFTVALALHWCGLVRGERREAAAVAAHGEELLALSREQHFAFFVALAVGLLGWSRVLQGDAPGGLALLREGVDRYRETGQRVGLRLRVEQAQTLLAAGAVDDALATTDEALAHVEANRERALLSEVYRVRAEALNRLAPTGAGPEALLTRALALADEQGADLLALRAATSLVRLQRERGGPCPALATLRDIHRRFTEGLELSDLRSARALLEG
jgi:transcriptional regulator with AAA-type ATPase domain/tetratricopeptide (TPR) repeat protein